MNPYRTVSREEVESSTSQLRWIFGDHTLVIQEVKVETCRGERVISIRISTAALNAPTLYLTLPFSVDALRDLSLQVAGDPVRVVVKGQADG